MSTITLTLDVTPRNIALLAEVLAQGVINDKDYRKIDTIFKQKYQPIIGTIYRKKP